jgi:hypothetical protein
MDRRVRRPEVIPLPARLRRRKIPGPEAMRRLELPDLPHGRGRAIAPLVWLALASHLRWGAEQTKVWPTNARLAVLIGAPLRAVEYGIAMLRRAGKISITYAKRGRCGFGRVIELHLLGEGPSPKVTIPTPENMAALWRRARAQRERPATVVALAIAAFALAAAQHHGRVGHRRTIAPKLVQLRRLVGATVGETFYQRLAALEQLEIIARAGEHWRHGITVFGHWVRATLSKAVAHAREILPAPRMRRCVSEHQPEPWTGPPPDEYGSGVWELVLEAG